MEKLCFPSLLVHGFWFAGKLAPAAFAQDAIPVFAKPTWGMVRTQKGRPTGWNSLPSLASHVFDARRRGPRCGRVTGTAAVFVKQ